jgi:hypothetical protein
MNIYDMKKQAEKRDGDKVEGYYKLSEPDGSTLTFHYTADKYVCFQAHVKNSRHATHSAFTKNLMIPSIFS